MNGLGFVIGFTVTTIVIALVSFVWRLVVSVTRHAEKSKRLAYDANAHYSRACELESFAKNLQKRIDAKDASVLVLKQAAHHAARTLVGDEQCKLRLVNGESTHPHIEDDLGRRVANVAAIDKVVRYDGLTHVHITLETPR